MEKSATQWNRLSKASTISENNQGRGCGENTVRFGYESPALTVLRFEAAAIMQASQTDLVPPGLPDELEDF